jgi:N6-L-threonylcarbamoyladenine synthase
MNILAIESSCDETACAVVKDGVEILGSAVATSTKMHEKWGGIVPEVAAREQLASILPVITETLRQLPEVEKNQNMYDMINHHIDAIAVTIGPGLIGSLLVGVETSRTLAYVTKKPLIPVNHVLAHMYANFVHSSSFIVPRNTHNASNQELRTKNKELTFPAISLVVSGGHTELFLMNNQKDLQWLGGTIDDAAGEAFDKSARLLGFGHGGGAAIENTIKNSELRITNDTSRMQLPRPMMHDDTYNFSFSGLKTAILREVEKHTKQNTLDEKTIHYLAYEVQEAITDVLVKKTLNAAHNKGATSILISGGVAANERLREKFLSTIHDKQLKITFFAPPIELCTDNAGYIGSYAFFRGTPVDWHTVTAIPDLSVEV